MINLVTCIRFVGSGFPVTDDLLRHQSNALQSWARVGANVHIIGHAGQVTWRELVEELSKHDVAAQVDSDIVLTPGIVKVFDALKLHRAPAWATSHRLNYHDIGMVGDPNIQPEAPYGLSIFVGNRGFWDCLASSKACDFSKLGVADDWAVCTYGNQFFPYTGYDFGHLRCVWHPRHGDRIENRGEFNAELMNQVPVGGSGIPPYKLPVS